MDIVTEITGLLGTVVRLIAEAREANDPTRIRRAKDVIDGELETERVLREGEEAAERLERGQIGQ